MRTAAQTNFHFIFNRVKCLMVVIAVSLTAHLHAQGNLQFNRVVNFNYSGTQNQSASGGLMTYQSATINVSAGKVLKIESAGVKLTIVSSPLQPPYFPSDYTNLVLNNIPIALESGAPPSSYAGTTVRDKSMGFPIWLSSGSYQVKLQGYSSNTNQDFLAYGWISAIEFNIVP